MVVTPCGFIGEDGGSCNKRRLPVFIISRITVRLCITAIVLLIYSLTQQYYVTVYLGTC